MTETLDYIPWVCCNCDGDLRRASVELDGDFVSGCMVCEDCQLAHEFGAIVYEAEVEFVPDGLR
jgi:hypothetical protein